MNGKWRRSLSRSIFFVLSLWLLSVLGFNRAARAEWKPFRAVPTGDIYYYDPSSIKHFPNGVVWVWVRIIETTGINEEEWKDIKNPKKTKNTLEQAERESTGEWRDLFEINCSLEMTRILSATSYDTKGKIRDNDETPSGWVYVSPNSVTNTLTEFVCRGKPG